MPDAVDRPRVGNVAVAEVAEWIVGYRFVDIDAKERRWWRSVNW